METKKINCELFIRGREEIDQKRKVITRVLATAESMLDKSAAIKRRKWKFGEEVLRIPLGELAYVLSHYKRALDAEIHDKSGKNQNWWGTTSYAEAIPAIIVPIVYEHLSKIVEGLDNKFPEAGIYDHFEFFINQANA